MGHGIYQVMQAPGVEHLDNPIWNALRTDHASVAEGDDRARRYPAAIGPLAGMPDLSEESFASLRPMAGEHPVVLFCAQPPGIPAGWKELRNGRLVQMVRTGRGDSVIPPKQSLDGAAESSIRQLTAADAPAMVALAELTEPGPFRLRTIELGNFYGVFHGDRLVSMAGKRMHLPGLVEVSGVCTHPDARGRGYARMLMQMVMDEIERDGRTPFLHAWADNYSAIRLYEQLGFTLRRNFDLSVLIAQ